MAGRRICVYQHALRRRDRYPHDGGGSDDSSVSASDSETSGGSSGSASVDNSASQGGSGCGSAMGGVLFCAVPALFAALSFKKKNS